MTPSPHSIGPGQTIAVALKLMRTHGVRHLPVLDGGNIIGLVSERELELVATLGATNPERAPVEQAMIPDPYWAEVDTPVAEVAAKMAERKLGSAVITRGGKLAGVFTTTDALRALAELAR
ncbi:MAG: CBS domain-containing protein [Deltaproteobacteria bacterium]|nr:CBS domain-containing protein [Deltaproteobacteria bacterium]